MTRGRIIGAIVLAVIVGMILLFGIRVEPTFAISWAAIAGILVVCTQLGIPEDPRADAPDIQVRRERRGTEISRMAWSLNPRTGEAGELLTKRVRGILRRRLSRRGLDVETDAHRAQIDVLIGDGVWERLTSPGTKSQDIERALAAIDRLAPSKEKHDAEYLDR